MSKNIENRVDFGPIPFTDTGLDIDYGEYAQRARREQAIAVRQALGWLNAAFERGVRDFGERLRRGLVGGADDGVRTL